MDGIHEAVAGTGQIGIAGTRNDGRLAYDQGQRIAKEEEQASTGSGMASIPGSSS